MKTKQEDGLVRNKIFEYIGEGYQVSPKDLCLHLNISQSMVHRHLLKLQKEGKIKKIGSSPKVFYVSTKQGLSKKQISSKEIEENIKNISRKVESVMKKYNVKKAELFGSMSRGDFNNKSDVDLLVDFVKVPDGWTLTGMIYELEERLGKKVDLVTEGSLSPTLAPYITKDLTEIYAKK